MIPQRHGATSPSTPSRLLTQPVAPLLLLLRERALYMRMVGRDIDARYRGSMLGLVWTLLNPLVLLAIFGFVFGHVVEARWGGGSQHNFSLVLFSGLSVFLLASECVNRAPLLVVQNASYVKKVVFPLGLLPPIVVGAAVVNFCIAMGILLVAQLFVAGSVSSTWFLLPLVLIPLTMMLTGLVYFVSALGVFLRDLSQVMGLVTLVLMYMSPVLFPIEAVPADLRDWLVLNPITIPVLELRAVTLGGQAPDWARLGLYTLAAYAVLLGGYGFFQRCRRGFADVL